MPTRGEQSPGQSEPMVPIAIGCGALLLLLVGGGVAAYFFLSTRTYTPVMPAPTITPVSSPAPPSLPAPVPAPPAEPALPPPSTDTQNEGTLAPDVIQRVVRRDLGAVRRCYEHALETQPDLAVRVNAQFVIGPDGTVTDATVTGSDDVELTTCVATRVRSWVFPAPEGGSVTVNFPFVFSSAE